MACLGGKPPTDVSVKSDAHTFKHLSINYFKHLAKPKEICYVLAFLINAVVKLRVIDYSPPETG